jgi:phosphoglycolate phosphatase
VANCDAVLFDLDGVVVDSRIPFFRGINFALTAQGLPPRPDHELHQYLGPPVHQVFEELVGDRSLVQTCVDAYRARYRELGAGETTVFPGVRELLENLSEQFPLVIATSKARTIAEPLLESLGLRRFFDAVIGPELDTVNESKATTIGRAKQEFSPNAQPVMVGDRKYDIAAAHAHGIYAIGVLWGFGSEDELRTAGADALAPTPADLATLLAPKTSP